MNKINWSRLLNIPYRSLASKLSANPIRNGGSIIRLQDHLYASCGNTTSATGYRIYSLYWTKGDVEAQLLGDPHVSPAGCSPLTVEELPDVEWYPKPIRSWMFRDVRSLGITYSSTTTGFRYKSLGIDYMQVHYLKSRRVPKELPFAIEILMRRRGEPRR